MSENPNSNDNNDNNNRRQNNEQDTQQQYNQQQQNNQQYNQQQNNQQYNQQQNEEKENIIKKYGIEFLLVMILIMLILYAPIASGIAVPESIDTIIFYADLETTDSDILVDINGVSTNQTEATIPVDIIGLNNRSAELTIEYRQIGSDSWSEREFAGQDDINPPISVAIGDLQPNTEYEVKASANVNEQISNESEIISFSTESRNSVPADMLLKQNTTNIDYNSAITSVQYIPGSEEQMNITLEYRQSGDTNWTEYETRTVTEQKLVEFQLTNLTEQREYVYKFTGITDTKIASTDTSSFETERKPVLTVSTGNAVDIDWNTTVVEMDVDDLGVAGNAEIQIKYINTDAIPEDGLDNTNTSEIDWLETELIDVSETGTYNTTLTELEPDTEYTYYAYGSSTEQMTNGDASTFVTEQEPEIEISIDEIIDITNSSAQINYSLDSLGTNSSVALTLEYQNTTEDNTTEDNTTDETWATIFENETFSETTTSNESITDLNSDTEYNVKLTAISSGEEINVTKTFTTEQVIEAQLADINESRITDESFDVSFTASTESNETLNVYIDVRTNTSDDWEITENIGSFNGTNDAGNYTLTNLEPNTSYQYQLRIPYQDKNVYTTEMRNITTIEQPPAEVVLNDTATANINKFTISATVEELNQEQINVSFGYRKTGNTTWDRTNTTEVTSEGDVTETITGLTSNQSYEYRLFVDEIADSELDEINEVSTLESQATVEISNINDSEEITSQNFTVSVTVDNFDIRPTGTDSTDFGGHVHVLINNSAYPKGDVIPTDSEHIHYNNGQLEDTISVPSDGNYTITAQLGKDDHTAIDASDSVDISINTTQ